MPYTFLNASLPIQKSPKDTMTDDFQKALEKEFKVATDIYTIQEETSFASEVYRNVDVRINNLVNPTTGVNVEDDYKKILFSDPSHPVAMGRLYQFNNNYWITINVDKVKTIATTVVVKRCNNTLRWLDENTGSLYTLPCTIEYLIKENRDYATAGSALVTPSGMIDCYFQINSKTNKIKPNQRFLFGNQNRWTAYRIEGGGINNFNNQETVTNTSATLGKFTMSVDYTAGTNDDLINGIANINVNTYTLELNENSISGTALQTLQLTPTIKLNGETVTRNVTWTSSNVARATVNSLGLVTFVSNGSCTITCTLQDNTSVFDTCEVTVIGTPVDTYQVIASPNRNYILEGFEETWNVYLYKNGVQQADAFVFTLNPHSVPSANYTYQVLGNNSFKIKNIKRFLTDWLDVECTSGSYSRILSVNLRGAW